MIFSEHIEKLKKATLKKWITQKEIDEIGFTEKRFIKEMDKYVDKKQKEKKSKK